MTREPRRGTKTESLSLRIDPKVKFALEFMVRVTGIRITELIERAIKTYSTDIKVGESPADPWEGKNWLHYWHPEEGVRTLSMLIDSDVPTNFDEDELVAFIAQHEEFFGYRDIRVKRQGRTGPGEFSPTVAFITVLWPRIHEFLTYWRETKSKDRWATGHLMLDAIRKAGMQGPAWPRNSKLSPPKSRAESSDSDEEVPF